MMCMEYALLQKNTVHNLIMWKSAYMVVMLVRQIRQIIIPVYYITGWHFILWCLKKKSLYLKCVFYFTISCGVGMGEWEGLGGKIYSP